MTSSASARVSANKGLPWALLVLVLVAPPPARGQGAVDPEHGMVAVGRALRGLGSVKRVLVIGAHPDDEDTALLTWVERGLGGHAAYLSLDRGEGGQNLIGPELAIGLGLIRTGELLAARELDGAEQFFTRAYDFGYSKSVEETFRFWSKDSLLADVVARIRSFRPQVVVSIFSGTRRDGHGQHQAAGILAREAFTAAADPSRFPEQLEAGLEPWGPLKLYRSTRFDRDATTLTVGTGDLDPLYGRSYHQIAMASRSQHRSQDMGRVESLGPRYTSLQLMESRAGTNDEGDEGLFAGVDTTFVGALSNALSGTLPADVAAELEAYGDHLGQARQAFLLWSSPQLVDALSGGLASLERAIGRLEEQRPTPGQALFILNEERRDLEWALIEATGFIVAAFADDDLIVPGQLVEVEVQMWNGGERALAIGGVELLAPEGWTIESAGSLPSRIPPDTLIAARFHIRVPRTAEPSRPYFLERPLAGALYSWPENPEVRGLPFGPGPLRARVQLGIGELSLSRDVEAVYRYADQARGEVRQPVRVVPAVSVVLEPGTAIQSLGGGDPLSFTVTLRGQSPDGAAGVVRILAPAGWGVGPSEIDFKLGDPGSERTFEFRVSPAPNLQPGAYTVRALAEAEGESRYTVGYTIIDYPHVRRSLIFEEAVARVEAFDLEVESGRRAGYVPGAGDAVAEAIEAMGVPIEVLSDRTLATRSLAPYDVLVLGVRAYETNPALLAANDRVLAWVRDGGTLIVQYQQYAYFRGDYAPYPMTARRPHDRVSDETAPLTILAPDHPVFKRPNRISAGDFEGWVQERGLYFPSEWDERYAPLIEGADPGEEPKRGALLVARYGEGLYVYTGLSLFRQLPAGVPGAYRLLANLLSLEP